MRTKTYRYAALLLIVLLITLYLFHTLFGIEKLASETIEMQMHNTYFVFAPWHFCVVLWTLIMLPVSSILLLANRHSLAANVAAVLLSADLIFGCTKTLEALSYFVYSQDWLSAYQALPGVVATQQAQAHYLHALVHAAYVLQGVCVCLLISSSVALGRHWKASRRAS